MSKARFYAIAGVVFSVLFIAAIGCSTGPEVKRVSANTVTDISGHWNDTDSKLVSNYMIREILKGAWLQRFENDHPGTKPRIIIGSIVNKTDEHIAVDTFTVDLEMAITNSGKATFVAGRGERKEVRKEREDQAVYASQATRKAPGQELGADYMLKGSISSITDRAGGVMSVYYQVVLTLIDLETSEKVWMGSKKIKKVIERPEWTM